MKIDMAKATVAWLTKWKEDRLAKNGSLYVRGVELDEKSAKFQYIRDKLDLYVQDGSSVSDSRVVLYVSTLYGKEIAKLMRTTFVLPNGIAVIDSIEAEIYHEAYCEEPSTRLEITFAVPAKAAK